MMVILKRSQQMYLADNSAKHQRATPVPDINIHLSRPERLQGAPEGAGHEPLPGEDAEGAGPIRGRLRRRGPRFGGSRA